MQPQKCFPLFEPLATMAPPSWGHVRPVERGLVLLHSGYLEQARNFPYLPVFITMAEPHLSHFSSVTCGIFSACSVCSALLAGRGFVFLHLGNPEHAKNLPCLPHLMTMGSSHFSHFSSVGMSFGLIFPLVFSTSARLWLKGLKKFFLNFSNFIFLYSICSRSFSFFAFM